MSRGKIWGYSILGVVALVVLSFVVMIWGFGISLFGITLSKPLENAQTGVTRSTNQYVTTQQGLMLKYVKEYNDAEKAGDKATGTMIAGQIRNIAITLDKQYVPDSVNVILTNEGMQP